MQHRLTPGAAGVVHAGRTDRSAPPRSPGRHSSRPRPAPVPGRLRLADPARRKAAGKSSASEAVAGAPGLAVRRPLGSVSVSFPPSATPITDAERALVVAAHPDDVDFGAAGTIAGWVAAGIEVSYLLVTRGDSGGFDATPRDQMPALREAEQRAAAAAVGVTSVEFLEGYSRRQRHAVAGAAQGDRPGDPPVPAGPGAHLVPAAPLRPHRRPQPPGPPGRRRGHHLRHLPGRAQRVRPARAAARRGAEAVDGARGLVHRRTRPGPRRRHHRPARRQARRAARARHARSATSTWRRWCASGWPRWPPSSGCRRAATPRRSASSPPPEPPVRRAGGRRPSGTARSGWTSAACAARWRRASPPS